MTSRFELRWADRLARALVNVADVQKHYWMELDEKRRQREYMESDGASLSKMSDPSRDLRSFYCWDCWDEGRSREEQYAPMRKVLEETRDIVGEHPALAGIARADDRRNEFGALFLNHGLSSSRLAMVAGLMCRASEVGKNGFRVASRELEALLNLSLGNNPDPIPEDLDLGYHVSVFDGLRFDEQFEIVDDVTVVPFGQTDAFVQRNVLLRVAPGLVVSNNWKSLGAIVKRFRWKPVLFSLDDEQPEVDWDASPFRDAKPFSEDARDFIELLAVTQDAPVVYLMDLALCTDRRASLLFGNPYYHSGAGWKSWAFSPGWSVKPPALDGDAIEKARRIFWQRDPDRHREYTPVISRLAEALARTGRYALEDKILDVAIALERMYEPESPELTFRLKTRAACFLEADAERRKRVFQEIGRFYEARSGIVHWRKKKGKRKQPDNGRLVKERQEAFELGFRCARRTLLKLLQDGPPTDWNDVVLEQGYTSRGSAGTTEPAYRNKNGQIVERRTDTAGNDHNKRVYVLRCENCGHQYGANGSDIWQRKCPECGGGRPGLSFH